MLSYQHAYHAGNLADLHKHGLLAWVLDYLTRKDKTLTYLETHAGRGLYDLSGPEAAKTGEALAGARAQAAWFAPDHPFTRAQTEIRAVHGADAYAGSPLIAATLLRPADTLHLAELHPGEYAALSKALGGKAKLYRQDGLGLAQSLLPPTPRRGLALIDPSYEVKDEYDTLARQVRQMARAWNVGVIVVWYPLLATPRHTGLLARLAAVFPDALRHEVRFPPARPGHGMIGSGLFVVNPPWGLAEEAARLAACFATLGR